MNGSVTQSNNKLPKVCRMKKTNENINNKSPQKLLVEVLYMKEPIIPIHKHIIAVEKPALNMSNRTDNIYI